MSDLNRIRIFLHDHEDPNADMVPVLVEKPHNVGLHPTREVLALVTARELDGDSATQLHLVASLEFRS